MRLNVNATIGRTDQCNGPTIDRIDRQMSMKVISEVWTIQILGTCSDGLNYLITFLNLVI